MTTGGSARPTTRVWIIFAVLVFAVGVVLVVGIVMAMQGDARKYSDMERTYLQFLDDATYADGSVVPDQRLIEAAQVSCAVWRDEDTDVLAYMAAAGDSLAESFGFSADTADEIAQMAIGVCDEYE